MPLAIQPEWQQLALYAVAGAVVLALLFRIPHLGPILRTLFSVAVLAFGLFVLLQQAPFDPRLSGLSSRLGLDNQQVVGDEVRIRLSPDGHFWAQVEINGVRRRMLVDSGATVTALSADTADLAKVKRNTGVLPMTIHTANGTVRAETGVVRSLRLGGISATDLKVVISPALGPIDVLGMNFLTQLAAWRVEGRTLILTPAAAPLG